MNFVLHAAPAIVAALIASVLCGAVAVGAVHFVIRVCRLESNAAPRFFLWFAALLSVTLVAPAYIGARSLAHDDVAITAVRAEQTAQAQVVRAFVRLHTEPAPPQEPVGAPAPVPAPSTPALGPIAMALLCMLWFAGFCVAAIRLVAGICRIHMLRCNASLLEMRASRRGAVAVLNADAFSVPVALGYLHPAVVLPTKFLALDRGTELEHVLMHELEHLRRFDDVTSLLQAGCLALLWFNPFAMYIGRRLTIEREMACDEAVVDQTGKRTPYAATLWKIAIGNAPALLSAFSSKAHTVVRMDNLLRESRRGALRRVPVAAVAALQVVALVGAAVTASAKLAGEKPVENFAIAALRDGGTLVAGGRDSDGRAVNSVEIYDRNGRRVATVPMHVARWGATATQLANGDVLVLGGMTNRGATSAAELYDLSTHAFRSLAPLRIARAGHSATLLANGQVVIAAGERSYGHFVLATEIYDPRTQRSTFGANGSDRVLQTALLIDDGNVLMFGGHNTHQNLKCAIIYDPARKGYRDAGDAVSAGAHTIVFKLPNGQLVTHKIRSA